MLQQVEVVRIKKNPEERFTYRDIVSQTLEAAKTQTVSVNSIPLVV
jgi:hypothetical protein